MIENYEVRIEEYVNNLFSNISSTKGSEEVKEELLTSLLDKYHDLLKNNMSDKDAYNKVILSVKSPNELCNEYAMEITKGDWDEKKSARITSISAMMYILCPFSVIVFDEVGFELLGIGIMFLLIAIATGLLIYNYMTKPQYLKRDSFQDESSNIYKSIRAKKSIENAMWSIIVVIYLLISLISGAWHITWVIFVIGVAVDKVIRAYFEYKEIDQ